MQFTPSYDVGLMQRDMTAKGWLQTDLARKAKVSHMTVARFFDTTKPIQTARTAKKLAEALGETLNRYLGPVDQKASA